jgi:hypothetical protein
MSVMSGPQQHQDFGRRILAEWIQMQQHIAAQPAPPEPTKDRSLMRDLATGFALLLMVALCGMLIVPAVIH